MEIVLMTVTLARPSIHASNYCPEYQKQEELLSSLATKKNRLFLAQNYGGYK